MSTKPLIFRNTTYKDLLSLPAQVIHDAGFQLSKVQDGDEPDDWKPMPSVGQGVMELRLWQSSGTYRVVYVAKFAEAVFVLHCFQKKAEKTESRDIELASQRYKELVRELRDGQ
jgi:phage-related protein